MKPENVREQNSQAAKTVRTTIPTQHIVGGQELRINLPHDLCYFTGEVQGTKSD